MLERPVPVPDSVCVHPFATREKEPRARAPPGSSRCFRLGTGGTQLPCAGSVRGNSGPRALSPPGSGGRDPRPAGPRCLTRGSPGVRRSRPGAELVPPGKAGLVSEPLLSLKHAGFVDLTGSLQTTLVLTGFCRGYEPRERGVKRELGHVFTWVYFILFLSWCSTFFYLLEIAFGN